MSDTNPKPLEQLEVQSVQGDLVQHYFIDTKTRYKQEITLVAGLALMLCAGILYMWSIFQPHFVSELGWAASSVSLTSSFMMASFVLGNIGAGLLQRKLSARAICLIGSALFCLGLFLTSFLGIYESDQAWFIYITYSLIGGIGVGFVYSTVLNVLQQWFVARAGFISGLTVGFFGLSTVVLSPIAESLLSSGGVHSTFRILAFVFLIVMMLASSLIVRPSQQFVENQSKRVKTKSSNARQFTPKELFKEPCYYMIALCLFASTAAYMVIVPFIKTIATDRELTAQAALVAVMVTGIANGLGRIVFPALGDKFGQSVPLIITAVISCCACLLMTVANSPILYIAAVFLIAFGYGGNSGINSVLARLVFGSKNAGTNYGLVLVFLAMSSVIFSQITNAISGGANPDFTPIMLVCAVVSVIPIPVALIMKKRAKKLGVAL